MEPPVKIVEQTVAQVMQPLDFRKQYVIVKGFLENIYISDIYHYI